MKISRSFGRYWLKVDCCRYFDVYTHWPFSLRCPIHSVHWGINLPPQNTPPLFSPLNLQPVQAPSLFRESPPPYWFFVNLSPALKVRFFSEPSKYQSFASLTPPYLLKRSEFWVSQFEFLVMTEKNIFAYIFFCH